jgi:UDP-glucose 4-epimerase
MNCLVLGGNGFIGSHIVDQLLAEGHHVRVFDKYEEYYRKPIPSVDYHYGDFGNRGLLMEALTDMDIVFHLIGTTLPKTSNDDPAFDVQSNVIETLFLLEQCLRQKVKKVIFISSGGTVYGTPKYLPIDEQHPTDPVVSYGITKLTIEKYLLMFQRLYGLQTTILRVSNPIGQRQRVETAQGAVTVFLHHALHGQPIEIWGDGSVTRDYIYIDDVARAFARSVEYSGTHSVFNISSGIGTSLNELVSMIGDVLGRRIDCRYLESRPFDVPVSILSNALAKDQLGWAPQVTLREGIVLTAQWMRSQFRIS